MLEVIASGKSHRSMIHYAVMISYPQIVIYLQYLVEKGLLNYNPRLRVYEITPKGLGFLKAYRELKSFLESNNKGMASIVG